MRSTIESLVKLPLDIPQEASVRVKKEEAKIVSINKSVEKNEVAEITDNAKPDTKNVEAEKYPRGYIKYPIYDFF